MNTKEKELIEAARKNDFPRIQEFIADGANTDIRDAIGNTLLMIAMEGDHIPAIEAIDDVTVRPEGEQVAVSFIYHGFGRSAGKLPEDSQSILRDLIANGSPINAQNHMGITALMVAATYREEDAIEFLLEQGADVKIIGDSNKFVCGFVT